MIRSLLVALPAAILICGSAEAAKCPNFPAPVIKFVPLQNDVERDTGKSAKEIGATGSSTKPLPVNYDHSLAGSAAEAIQTQTQPDGTVCAALQEFDVKLGIKRKILIAQEFAGDACVADTIADIETPVVKSDDAVLAEYGASIAQRFAAEVNAIGTTTGKTPDEAKQPILDKISVVFKEKIFPAFSQMVVERTAKVDLTKWQKASCNGATDKAFVAINGNPSDATRNNSTQQQQQSQAASKAGGGYGGGGNYGGSAGRY
jgi:hypothetical protein